ncbi:MAG: hypothetical protein U0Q16_03155 [Bryobacteraceae bacterium]
MPAFSAGPKTFQVVMKARDATINKDVAAALGAFVFPKHTGTVKLMTALAGTIDGLDASAKLTITDQSLTFVPNGLMDAMTMSGLKTVQVPARDVLEIFEVTSSGFKELVLVTRSGNLYFHLDGSSARLLLTDFEKAREDLTRSVVNACRGARVHYQNE